MKKLVPFLFPILALVIVFVVAIRWYNGQATHEGEISDTAAGIQIGPVTASDAAHLSHSAKDASSIELQGSSQGRGNVRYEVKNGKLPGESTLIFSVNADLPSLPTGQYYQVWLVTSAIAAPQKAFILELTKGGYIGSGAVSTSILPVTLEITLEKNQPNQSGTLILKGILPKS